MIIRLFLISFIPWVLFASKPDLLLLKTYKDQNITGWVMSEKLDGIRAYWDGTNLISRGGKIIHAPKWFIKDYPPFELDGELWTKRNDFENISSIVRDKIPKDDWIQVTHNIFEVPNAKGGLFERLKLVIPYENEFIKIVPQIKIENKKYLKKFHDDLESLHAEGVVVRDPQSKYINKRTSKALKVKRFKDDECKIIGYTKGKGKYKNQVGAIICKLKNGIKFKIGSGLNDTFRKKPLKKGIIITFKYQSLTKNGKPRFTVFQRIRKNVDWNNK